MLPIRSVASHFTLFFEHATFSWVPVELGRIIQTSRSFRMANNKQESPYTKEAESTLSTEGHIEAGGRTSWGEQFPGKSPHWSPRASIQFVYKSSSEGRAGGRKQGWQRFKRSWSNNILQIPDVQVVESELCRRAESLTWLSSRLVTARISAGPRSGQRRSSSPLPASVLRGKQYEVRLVVQADWCHSSHWLAAAGRSVRVGGGSVKLLCGGSCGRSRWRPLPTATRGPHRSTRYAPPCGARGWCGSAGPPGSATPWAGSSAGRGCRSWSRPACWPSGGSLVRTAAEKEAGLMFSDKPWVISTGSSTGGF